MKPSKIELVGDVVRLSKVEMHRHEHEKKWYEAKVRELQLAMLRIQQAYHHHQRRAMLVFEGWDAGGKGGAIRRLTGSLDPRGYSVHPIGAPTAVEQGKHYLYRFWRNVPAKGQIAVFDRSWYGRVLVERVEGFTEEAGWSRAYREINEFERLLIDDGVRIVKFFLHITPEEQLKRFVERLQNPHKQWKLTEDDLRNRDKWDEYVSATEDMIAKTSTQAAPWHVIGGNYKWYARTEVLKTAVDVLSQDIDLTVPGVNPDFIAAAKLELGLYDGGEPGSAGPADEDRESKKKKSKKKKKKKKDGKKSKSD